MSRTALLTKTVNSTDTKVHMGHKHFYYFCSIL